MTHSLGIECPICGHNSKRVCRIKTINPDSDILVDVLECLSCRHWWHNPVPSQEDLLEMYAAASPFVVSVGAKDCYKKKTDLDSFQHYLLNSLNHLILLNKGNYLEIGAGGGHLLKRVQRLGYRCFGVEPGQWVECEDIVSDIEQLPPNVFFDVIVLQDVLEHIVDIVYMLKRLRQIANDKAELFCSFPFKDSRPARQRSVFWPMLRPYGHLHYFSAESVNVLFTKTKWDIIESKIYRCVPIRRLITNLKFRCIAYELIKGGKDQLFVRARAMGIS